MTRKLLNVLFIFITLIVIADKSCAQGFIVSNGKQQIATLQLQSNDAVIQIKNNNAVVEVLQTYYNPYSYAVSGVFYYAFPDNGEVVDPELYLDNAAFNGVILDRNESKELSSNLVKDGYPPSFFSIRNKQLFKAAIYQIPSNEKINIKFRYTQKLKQKHGIGVLVYPTFQYHKKKSVTTAYHGDYAVYAYTKNDINQLNDKTEDNFVEQSVQITVHSDSELQNIFSLTNEIDIKNINKNKAEIAAKITTDSHDFILYFTQSETPLLNVSLLTNKPVNSDDGYFVLSIAPGNTIPDYQILSKDVIFVVDASGSMKGEKIREVREALKYCLNSMSLYDYFNIITFSSGVKIFNKELVKISEHRDEALGFIHQINAKGGANINEALLAALNVKGGLGKVKNIVFITSCLPTVGITEVAQIIDNVKKLNIPGYEIHTIAIGNEIDTRLIDGLAYYSNANAVYIENASQVYSSITTFFNRINKTVFSNLKIEFPGNVFDVYPQQLPNIYLNTNLTITGRYNEAREGEFHVRADGYNGTEFNSKINFDNSMEDVQDIIALLWLQKKSTCQLEEYRITGDSEYRAHLPQTGNLFFDAAQLQSLNNTPIGKEAVTLSRKIQELKALDTYDFSNNILSKSDKVFIKSKDGYWEDTDIKQAVSPLHIKYASPAYFELVALSDELTGYFSIGDKLKLSYKGHFIQIDESGLEKLNKNQIQTYNF